MVLIVRFACALALMICAASAVDASPRDAISAMKGRQVAEWRRTVIDLGVVGSYYDDPANQPIWVNNGSPTAAAAELLEALSRADEDGLDTNDYLSDPIIDSNRLTSDDDAAGYELAMSQAFLAFARDIHSGKTSPAVNASDIVIPRKPVDAVAWLSLARDSGVEGAIEKLRPEHPQYFQLRQMLKGYRALASKGGWPAIDKGGALKPGMTDPRVGQMRANLKARGYAGIDNAEANFYDDNIVAVVEHFQRRNGLDADGVAGPKTIAAMNVTADERVRQIIVNMERWRWLPEQLGSRYVFVNQAGFEMFLLDKGQVVDRHKVIVGKPFHKTPMFSDKIAYAEFNPTWTVTPAIAAAEFLPKLQSRPRLSRTQRLRSLWRLGCRRAGHRPVVGRLERRRRQEIPVSHRAAAGTEECARRRQVHVSQQVQHLPARYADAPAVRADWPCLQPWLYPRARAGEIRRKAVRPGQFADAGRHQEADRRQDHQDRKPEDQGAGPSRLFHGVDRR